MSGTVYGIRPHRPITEAEDKQLRAAAEAWPLITIEEFLKQMRQR